MDNQYIHRILRTKLAGVNSEVKLINHGGCGHSALALYNELITYDIHCDIVYIGGAYIREGLQGLCERTETDNVNDALISMFEGLDTDISPKYHPYNDHIGILFDGVLYDSEGRYTKEIDCIGSEHIRVKVMELFLMNRPSWNRTFHRANHGNPVERMQAYYHNMLDIFLGDNECLR